MSKEILAIVDAVSNEKAIDREKVFEALEGALAIASKKKFEGLDVDIKATINRKNGDFTINRRWLVVDKEGSLEYPSRETTLEAARVDEPNIVPGDYVEEQLEAEKSINSDKNKTGLFDRITAQTVKQVLQQKIKEAERQQVIDMFQQHVGKVVIGTVKKATRELVTLDLGNNAEAVLRRPNMIPRDSFRNGDRVRSLLLPIRTDGKGPQMEVSRTTPEFLKELLTIEVPEIGEGQLEIINAVRDPGLRSKVAIRAKDKRIDPKGACIGMKGSRIKNVSNELCNENIDIIVYDENFSKYVINAMEPAEVKTATIDKTKKLIELGVDNDERKYARAIGSNGQNVKLASALIGDGWKIKVMTTSEMERRQNDESERLLNLFCDALNVDQDFAQALIDAGFSTIEEIAFVEPQELMACIDGIDEDIVAELQKNANESRLHISTPSGKPLSIDLINLEGMDTNIAIGLAQLEISTLEELADCASDDLADITDLEPEKAGALIMAARNLTWFKDGK
ncbi:MAG: transcription termination factor NusA [Succinivibrionaceae bacterium]